MVLTQPFPRVVDDVTIRLVAGAVLCVSVAAIALRAPWVFGLLAVDFVLRTAFGPRWSPLARLAGLIRPWLKAAPRPTPGPPKRFAAFMGAVFTLAIAIFAYTGLPTVAWALAAIMVLFPALEAFLGICVGCRVFGVLIRAGIVPESICVECADISLRGRSPRSGVRPSGDPSRPASLT
jgi:hypothetical protein